MLSRTRSTECQNASVNFCRSQLGKMRLKVRHTETTTVNDAAMIEALAEELVQFSPEVVQATCTEWARRSKWWPTLSELLELAQDFAERQARKANPAPKSTLSERLNALLHMGWPATRIAAISPDASEFIISNPGMSDTEIIAGLVRIESGQSKPRRKEVAPPVGKPMAKAFELCREPRKFLEAPRMIGMYLAMVERFHGRDEAEFQAGQLAVEATGGAVDALRHWTGKAMA
jgi:hypothetical protein